MASAEPRAVLVTGCSSGIGLCLAESLRARGYRVFATARKPSDVAMLAARGFEAMVLDLDSPASIRAAVDELMHRTDGRLYALVNNAAFGLPGAVEDLSRDALRAQFETNVFGTQELTNRVVPAMRAANEGRIIQISSLLGIVCLAYRGAYSASKFALEALSDTMRLELCGTNIRVVLIEPGPITSRFRSNAYATYKLWIDKQSSPHREYYASVEARLSGEKPLPFTLPPESVAVQVVRALESHRPKIRYRVTLPSQWLAVLKRLLPARVLDSVAAKISGGGKR